MHIVVFVDLDGTLIDPKVNNTYDFISFLYYCRLRSLALLKLVMFIMARISYMIAIMLSKLRVKMDTSTIFISSALFCSNLKRLESLSLYWLYLLLRKKFLRTDVIKKIIKIEKMSPSRVEVYVLTCCVEYPACIIAEKLGYKCLSRELRKKGGITVGLKDIQPCYITKAEKYANTIKSVIKECLQRPYTIYIVDKESARSEEPLLRLFDKVIIV